jgi:hypothetical protein
VAKPRAFIETTIVNYLTAFPSKDADLARDQRLTRDWWATCGDHYELVTSPFVLSEARAGDAAMAKLRLDILATIQVVDLTAAAYQLADELIRSGALPEKARTDALHVAAAATNRVDYLVTWNCKHLANEALQRKIGECCRAVGFKPALIRTPADLLGVKP